MQVLPDTRPQAVRVREYFSGASGQDRYLYLVHYAERFVRSMRWCIATDDDSIPGGEQAKDIVHSTVQSLLADDGASDGHRNLPAGVAVEVGIKKIIRSNISHAAESFENTHREEASILDEDGDETSRLDTDVPFWDPSTRLSAHQKMCMAARCGRFLEFCAKDKIVCNMLMVIRDLGIDKPAERLARALGVPVAQVYIARKRLGTLLRQFGRSKQT